MKPSVSLSIAALLICSLPAFGQAMTGMFGPSNPGRVDTNGNGPDLGDPVVLPSAPDGMGNSLIANPWSCGGINNQINVSNPVGGRFRTASRSGGSVFQTVNIDGVAGNSAIHMNLLEFGTGISGAGGFVDSNADGIYDQIVGETPTGFTLGMVFFDSTGDGFGDWVSIPWAQASLLGVNPVDTCGVGGTTDPQIWVPLADTNGDGRPDSVVFDLDNNGLADPALLWGPIVGPALVGNTGTIPTLSTVGMIFMALGLALAGAFLARGNFTLGV